MVFNRHAHALCVLEHDWQRPPLFARWLYHPHRTAWGLQSESCGQVYPTGERHSSSGVLVAIQFDSFMIDMNIAFWPGCR